MIWTCPYCNMQIEGLSEEDLLMQINSHLDSHRPFMQKLMGMLFGQKKKQQDDMDKIL